MESDVGYVGTKGLAALTYLCLPKHILIRNDLSTQAASA